MQKTSQREMAKIIADNTSMTAKELRAMSTIVLMAAEVALARERDAPLPEIGPASVEFIARVICKAGGYDPDISWRDYEVQAEAAAEWFRCFLADTMNN